MVLVKVQHKGVPSLSMSPGGILTEVFYLNLKVCPSEHVE